MRLDRFGAPGGDSAAVVVDVVAGARLPADARALRQDVFAGEQGIDPSLEADGRDDQADHAVVRDAAGGDAAGAAGDVVATGRLLDPGPPGDTGLVGRVAVRPDRRGEGHGLVVMRVLERRAGERGLVAVELHAQAEAVPFYERQGYVGVGPRYLEAGIEHLTMRRELLPGLRPVRDADGAGLERLIGVTWSEYPGCVLDVDGEEPWLRAPAATYAANGGAFWVLPAPDGTDVLACAGLRPAGYETVELKSLYVAAAARRRGWGGALVWRVERQARAVGARRVELWSDTRFGDAHRLYDRLGYVPTGRTRELHDRSATVEYEFSRTLPPTP